VIVVCSTCDLGLEIPISPMTRLREGLKTFFTDHDDCETTIDLSQAGQMRLPAAPGMADRSTA
jgi:hypothetical protein